MSAFGVASGFVQIQLAATACLLELQPGKDQVFFLSQGRKVLDDDIDIRAKIALRSWLEKNEFAALLSGIVYQPIGGHFQGKEQLRVDVDPRTGLTAFALIAHRSLL